MTAKICEDPAQPKNASILLQLNDVETGQNGSKSISNIYSVQDGDRGRQSNHSQEVVVRVRVYLGIFRDIWTKTHNFQKLSELKIENFK